MHFSLIQPMPMHEREAAYERTRGAYEDHQWLWERFFPAPRGAPRDFLFRRLDAGSAARFHVVSARSPQGDVPGWQVKSKPYHPHWRWEIACSLSCAPTPSSAAQANRC